MERVLDRRLPEGETMKEIFEMRLVLEMGIVDILFLRKREEGLKELEEIVKKEEMSDDKIEHVRFDAQFHSTLYKISGNKTIQRFQKMLLPIFDYVDKGIHVKSQTKNADYVSHRVLLNTLKNGTPEEFRTKMKNHLLNYYKKLSRTTSKP
jgi:DNA-binding FadR family transcriptional regulator